LLNSEFINTAVTENNWVCELEGRATELFTIGNVGLILGTAVFSALADYKGMFKLTRLSLLLTHSK